MQEPNQKPSDKIPDGYFLYNSIPFNYRLNTPLLNGYVEYLFYRIYISNRTYKPDDKLLALNSLISNLLTAHYNHKLLAVSFNPNTYKKIDAMYGMTFYTYTNIINPIQWMRSRELLGKFSGYYDIEKKAGKNSRIWATPELIREVEAFILVEPVNYTDLTYQLKYDNPIVLKKKKQLINYRPNEQTLKMKKFLNEYNHFMKSQEISVPIEVSFFGRQKNNFQMSNFLYSLFNYNSTTYIPSLCYNSHITNNIQLLSHTNPTSTPLLIHIGTNSLLYKGLNTNLYRVFNNNFFLGGRFYGGDYQGFPENMRSEILINGEKVAELDYSSYHFMMLYHLSGIDYKSDPYSAVNDNPELRPLLKLVCNICINAGSKGKAVAGFNYEVYYKDPKKPIGKRKFYREIMEKYHLSFEDLYNQFTATHKPLEKHFLSGVGLKLQYLDSIIAEEVMGHFLKKGIPNLGVHDSFIVPENYKDELDGVMKEYYKNRFGYDIKIK